MNRKRSSGWGKKLLFFFISVLVVGIVGGTWGTKKFQERAEQMGCNQLSENVVRPHLFENKDTIRFVALGDTGTGDENQKKVAASVKRTCQKDGCDFVLLLGDNFYPHGVDSLHSPLFNTQFEDIYRDFKLPFYSVLGNHDTQGDVGAQIYHSLRSTIWRMPNYNYQFKAGPLWLTGVNSSCFAFSLNTLYDFLSKHPDEWNLVFAHHTIYSSGNHGDSYYLIRAIWQTFFQDKIDFYLSGHDHHLEHLTVKNEKTDYLVSGAGGKHYRDEEDRKKGQPSSAQSVFKYQDNGYVWVSIGSDIAQVRYLDGHGKTVYQFKKRK